MSALESIIASTGEAGLHPSLMYELPAPSTAVVDRRHHVRFYPTSASSLSLTGTKTFRIRIGGEEFIDPSSLRLQYTIVPEGNKKLAPLTGPWGAWSQMFCRSNGVELDNIPNYNRFHQQYGWNHLTRAEQFGSVGIEGFHVSKQEDYNDFKPCVGIISGTSPITVMHRLHFSILNSGKLLPVKYMPLEIEGMLADSAEWIYQPTADEAANGATMNFTIQDIQVLANSFVLDEAVLQSFYSALLKNRVMSIPVMNAYQIMHPMPDNCTTYSFSTVRAFSRVAQVWLTFRSTGPKAKEFVCPNNLHGPAIDDGTNALYLGPGNPPTARLSVGPKNYPDPQPVSSAAEYYYMLVNALGAQPNFTRSFFEYDAFTIVWDLRKNPGDSTSAISTRSGDLLRVEIGNIDPAKHLKECWMTIVSFGVCAIRESGVALLT
jgi:hypothetical protein